MDIWHYPRTQLATFILNGMDKGLLQRVSIFAPRKRGKNSFKKISFLWLVNLVSYLSM
ncbi:hypothetical protein [Vibrio alginolyticus]|uniref:hypothetical protein n=1 Tax=Vibrio alginolyticus TaxID=663 RepID=UPI001867BEF6|nr:hypothetical protein [Vibrio alginolyticus]